DPAPAPAIDANGALGGTSHSTTFTEDAGQIAIVASDATLTHDGNVTSMTLTLGATPDGTSESIAYSDTLNGGTSLASLHLSGSYDSATRTFTISAVDPVNAPVSTADFQSVLRAMVYNNSSQSPSTTARTVTISATDDVGVTGQTTSTIGVTAVND